MPRHATRTSYKPGSEHPGWKGGDDNYWRQEARKTMNAPDGLVVHHEDGNWANNSTDNLSLITQAEHVAIHNKERAGQMKPHSKIRMVIMAVLALRKQGFKRQQIANKLNINQRMVKRCLSDKWRYQYE